MLICVSGRGWYQEWGQEARELCPGDVVNMHHLHDGPFSGFNAKPISTKPRATLAALQWAADRAGQSYGQFTIGLSTADQLAIQAEYEQFLSRRKEEMVARVDTDKPSTSTPDRPIT